jgi:penicillin amidase
LEAINENHPINAKSMLSVVDLAAFKGFEPAQQAIENWNGSHDLESIAPTFYYKWLYHTLRGMMADELGEDDFQNFIKTFMYIRSVPTLIRTDNSPWWDNSKTEAKESKAEIVKIALGKTISELSEQLGTNSEKWLWEKIVVLEHPHPLGAKKPLDKIFNVKAPAVTANEESVNKLPFTLNPDGIYKVNSGPAMRIIIDFSNVEASESVLPTGQSGNLFSPHYSDQAVLYATGKYRPMLMSEEVIKGGGRRLVVRP